MTAGAGAASALESSAPGAGGPDAPADPHVERFNKALEMPFLDIVRMFLRAHFPALPIARFVDHIADAPGFPDFSIGSLLAILPSMGADVRAAAFDFDDAGGIPLPFLCRLKAAGEGEDSFQLVQALGGDRVQVVADGKVKRMTRTELRSRWTGIVLYAEEGGIGPGTDALLEAYRNRLRVLPDILSAPECERLIDLAERQGFRRSRIKGDGESDGAVSLRVRSSSTTVLGLGDPVLRRLYEACAAYEGVDVTDLEWAQCVRYKPGQRFNPHFDGGNGMPRLATWLLYLNDDFKGGGTGFPELDLVIRPRKGTVVRFDNCDSKGRILWPSKHSGQPLESGTKYALNLWVRLPGRQTRQSPPPALGRP